VIRSISRTYDAGEILSGYFMVALFFRADNLGYNPRHPAFAINTATSSKERTERKQTQNTNQQIDSSADSFIRFTVELGKNDPHQTDWSKPNCTYPQNHDEADLLENLGKPPAVVEQINFSTPVAEDKNMIPDYDELLNDWEILIKSGGIHPDRKHKRLITSPKNYIKRERFYSNRIERGISLEELRHILAGEKVVVILGRVVYADIFGIE